MLKYEVVEPTKQAEHCVIWLHGLGADGYDFVPIVTKLKLNSENIRFIFPHANIIPITVNGFMEMRSWYDIKSMDATSLHRDVDTQTINTSIKKIEELIESQVSQCISPENIILIGFSQGGVIATYSALLSDYNFAGVGALSTYLPAWNDFKQKIQGKKFPVLVCHGSHDQILPPLLGRVLAKTLKEEGFPIEFKEYQGMQHSICLEEINKISDFINHCFNNKK